MSQKVYETRRNPDAKVAERFKPDGEHEKKFGARYNLEKWSPLLTVDFKISHECCTSMKKRPVKKYEKETGRAPIIGTLAEESFMRINAWLKHGCNAFDAARPTSQPLSFWTEQDILQYIKNKELPIASVYGEIITTGQISMFPDDIPELCCTGCNRTGCTFCGFGVHSEKGETRFQRLKRTHPRLWEYCISGGAYDPEDGLWKPNKQGLGLGHVFDTLNDIYGADFIRFGKE